MKGGAGGVLVPILRGCPKFPPRLVPQNQVRTCMLAPAPQQTGFIPKGPLCLGTSPKAPQNPQHFKKHPFTYRA